MEAKKASELDSKSATVWATLGWVLQHDLIGRPRMPGFDHAGALAAYRKAMELDPADASTGADLAILLEHDAQGQRYSPKARMTEAIEVYKALGDKLADTSLADNLLFAYAYAGRFEELKKSASEGQQTQSRRALTLVAIAHLQNPEAAVQEAFRWTLNDETRRGALQTASNILMRLRNFPPVARCSRRWRRTRRTPVRC